MKNLEEYYLFMDKRIDSLEHGTSNCIGTALYIVGEQDFDDPERIIKSNKFENLNQISYPLKGCIVAWKEGNQSPLHAGVITEDNPKHRFIAREYNNGPYFKNLDLEEENKSWEEEGTKMVFYIPSKLQKIINLKKNKK